MEERRIGSCELYSIQYPWVAERFTVHSLDS